jgi:hypothetical protein
MVVDDGIVALVDSWKIMMMNKKNGSVASSRFCRVRDSELARIQTYIPGTSVGATTDSYYLVPGTWALPIPGTGTSCRYPGTGPAKVSPNKELLQLYPLLLYTYY